jgi:CO/xanthine dehydrogenase Mo-binding subunit
MKVEQRQSAESQEGFIGAPYPRPDSVEKVTGAIRYAGDLMVPGLLHARLVLSPEPHARIRTIEAGEALQVAGVVAVLTAADLPIVAQGPLRHQEPLARDEVVFAGQPVAMVVAESEAAAEDGAEAVVVDYSALESVVDFEAAMAPGAPLARAVVERVEAVGGVESVHAAVAGGGRDVPEEDLSENVLGRSFHGRGDVSEALAASAAVVTRRYRTSWVHQGYLEPQVATAWVEPAGELVVSTSTQGTFYTRDELAKLFGLPVSKVRVQAEALGGAFGGKFLIVEPLAAGAALVLRRPVRLALTRSEDFIASNPAPASVIELRIGAQATGELTGLDARIVFDRGTNLEWGLEEIAAFLVGGPYRWPAYAIRAYSVQTNRVGFGSYRAPGAPPAAFAVESLLDELAETLGTDPLDLRLQNVIVEGDAGLDGKPWPRVGVRECLEQVKAHPLWGKRNDLPPGEGVGMAVATWPGGNEPAAAACRLESDGGLTIVTGAVDMTGTETAFAAIAAETFGVPLERVTVTTADTATAPYAPVSGGSKITYTVGRAVERAAAHAREQLLGIAAEELETAPEDLEIVDGVIRPIGVPAREVSVAELAGEIIGFGSKHEPVEGQGRAAQTSLAPSTAAHLVHLRVDRDTGRVDVLGYVVAQDVGRALNPAMVEGQMRGGVAQGIGWALYEELIHDDGGQPLTGSFLEYTIPSADTVPEIETLIVEVPAPDGPFGAKGVGEAPVIAAPAAVANAVAAASGARMDELPMTAPRVWTALSDLS